MTGSTGGVHHMYGRGHKRSLLCPRESSRWYGMFIWCSLPSSPYIQSWWHGLAQCTKYFNMTNEEQLTRSSHTTHTAWSSPHTLVIPTQYSLLYSFILMKKTQCLSVTLIHHHLQSSKMVFQSMRLKESWIARFSVEGWSIFVIKSHLFYFTSSAKTPGPGMSFHISISLLHDCILM